MEDPPAIEGARQRVAFGVRGREADDAARGPAPSANAQHNAVPSMQWGSGEALRLILSAPRPTKVQEHASLTQTCVSSALLRPV